MKEFSIPDPQSESIPLLSGEEEFTGRALILFDPRAGKKIGSALRSAIGKAPAFSRDFTTESFNMESVMADAGAVVLDEIGVCVVEEAYSEPTAVQAIGAQAQGAVAYSEPERVVRAFSVSASGEGGYLQGYRDATVHLIDEVVHGEGGMARSPRGYGSTAQMASFDESRATWGLQAVKAVQSVHDGSGARVAVLDTGLDLNHPDFGAVKLGGAKSFVAGETTVQDGNGHGTHCCGTACGPRGVTPRYGVASGAELFVGKVLSNAGSGADGGILAGINWAIQNKCHVISMSLGARVGSATPYSQTYESVARRALDQGCLIVAAAGNDGGAVSHPAYCPSILAVAALDAEFKRARFSNYTVNHNNGGIDIGAPGVDVYSSYPMPRRYRRLNGTSMATPHVAGVAALLAGNDPNLRGYSLWASLTRLARRLPVSSIEAGIGLLQAP